MFRRPLRANDCASNCKPLQEGVKYASKVRSESNPMRILAVLLLLTGIAACETVKGVGRDITGAGQALDNTF